MNFANSVNISFLKVQKTFLEFAPIRIKTLKRQLVNFLFTPVFRHDSNFLLPLSGTLNLTRLLPCSHNRKKLLTPGRSP